MTKKKKKPPLKSQYVESFKNVHVIVTVKSLWDVLSARLQDNAAKPVSRYNVLVCCLANTRRA